jgi:hypothetical protein
MNFDRARPYPYPAYPPRCDPSVHSVHQPALGMVPHISRCSTDGKTPSPGTTQVDRNLLWNALDFRWAGRRFDAWATEDLGRSGPELVSISAFTRPLLAPGLTWEQAGIANECWKPLMNAQYSHGHQSCFQLMFVIKLLIRIPFNAEIHGGNSCHSRRLLPTSAG